MRLLLLFDLRAPGAHRADAASLVRALRRLGHEVVAVAREEGAEGGGGPRAVVSSWPGLRGWLRMRRDFGPDHVVLVSADRGRGLWAAAACARAPVLIWPPPGAAFVGVGVDLARAARERRPLWDGEYVLAPAPLEPRAGRALLRAFARVAVDHAQLELVVLALPQPALVRHARRHGLLARVHFAGEAAGEAEWSWVENALAVALFPAVRTWPGLALRVLACGRPLLTGAGSPEAARVEPGVTGWVCPARPAPLAEALAQAVEGHPAARAVEVGARARARGRSWTCAARELCAALGAAAPHPARRRDATERAA